MRTLVIAEAASAHDGALEQALRLIDVAADADADAVKFQFWSDADQLADRRHVPAFYRAIYHRYRMPPNWLPMLHAHAKARHLLLGVTCYLPEDVREVAPYTAFWKIASFESLAMDLRDTIAKSARKPVVLSVGMSEHLQMERARAMWRWVGESLMALACVSAYPAPIEACQLSGIREHGLEGFSDHTANVLTGALAVCAGAKVVECHIRLDDTDPQNPDYACALSPSQAAEYVRLIRLAESAMGDGIKAVQPCELAMSAYRVRA